VGLPTAAAFVGIDVSKDSLDACLLLPGGKERQAAFANDARGHAALLAWADRHAAGCALHFCLEATGPHSGAHPPAGRRGRPAAATRSAAADPAEPPRQPAAGWTAGSSSIPG
jgi:hypothetical protein